MSFFDFASGCIAGSAGIFVGYPLDTLKVKLQTESKYSLGSNIVNIYRQNRIGGFFRGMTFPLITSGFINSIFFGVYGHVCSLMGESNYGNCNKAVRPSFSTIYLASCAGGIVQVGVVIPIELVKVKLQAECGGESTYRGSFECIRRLWRTAGFRGCYQGATITVLRDVPSYGLYMLVYEWILYNMSTWKKRDMFNTLIAGGCAGMVSWFVIIPLDVVKTRIQANDLLSPRYKGIIHCFRESYAEGGIRIFFKGATLMMLRAFPVNATTLFVYATSLSFFNSHFR